MCFTTFFFNQGNNAIHKSKRSLLRNIEFRNPNAILNVKCVNRQQPFQQISEYILHTTSTENTYWFVL